MVPYGQMVRTVLWVLWRLQGGNRGVPGRVF